MNFINPSNVSKGKLLVDKENAEKFRKSEINYIQKLLSEKIGKVSLPLLMRFNFSVSLILIRILTTLLMAVRKPLN